MKLIISAQNRTDLMKKLSEIDISVPPRSEGRTTEHCERWSICRWLSSNPLNSFPMSILHRDKPDFFLETSDQKIGLELTEAIPQDYAHASAISEKSDNDTVLDKSLFKWGQKKMIPDEIYKRANKTKLAGPGWTGDSAEIELAQAMYNKIQTKTKKLRKKDFNKYDKNLLLIYNNLPLPYIDYSKASSLIRENLNSYWSAGLVFDVVFVQTINLLIFFSEEEIKTFETNSVW